MGVTKNNRAMFTSLTCEWATPRKLFQQIDLEFHFTLDVCATPENACCSKFYTREDDGLSKTWAPHICWMNPPYGPDLKQWMQKAYEEWQLGATVVCLVPARTDTRWWHDYAMKSPDIRFIRGRLHFNDGPGTATFPSCVIVFPRIEIATRRLDEPEPEKEAAPCES